MEDDTKTIDAATDAAARFVIAMRIAEVARKDGDRERYGEAIARARGHLVEAGDHLGRLL